MDSHDLSHSIGTPDVAPGEYVALEVSDTGPGMDPEVRQHIFEPFFTTKSTGRGLGLAAVHGIVVAHHGVIRIDSRPGGGTMFQVLLPRSESVADRASESREPERPVDEATGQLDAAHGLGFAGRLERSQAARQEAEQRGGDSHQQSAEAPAASRS